VSRFFAGMIAACLAASSHAQVIRVGSKNFTEQFIAAEIYAQALESAGIKAQTRTNLGATLIAHAALLNGDIDLYPEYTGTAMAHVVKGDLSGTAEQTYDTVKNYYEKNLRLTLLAPTRVNNGYAIVVLPETAAKYQLRTLTDLGPASKNLSFGAEGSFADRSDGLPGMAGFTAFTSRISAILPNSVFAIARSRRKTSMSLSALPPTGRSRRTDSWCSTMTSTYFRRTFSCP
jgi:osmoprotectant transport system substrate-binding protein